MFNNCSCKLIYSTAIALNGTTSLQVTIPVNTFNNGECFGLKLVQAIPSSGTPLPVQIVIGSNAYYLQKPCGNYVMSDQLRSGRTYCLRVGTNPNHFTVKKCNALCGTAFVAPQLVGTAAAAAAAAAAADTQGA